MANESLSALYTAGNKNWGAGTQGPYSLAMGLALFTPGTDPTDATSEYNNYAGVNDWVSTPKTNISLKDIQTVQAGLNTFGGQFKFNPLLNDNVAAGCYYGSVEDYPKSVPVWDAATNPPAVGNPAFYETSVGDGDYGARSFGASSYATTTSVARGSSYKLPTSTANTAVFTLCVWIKPTVPGAARNWLWNDMDGIGDTNPYRGIGCNMQTSGQIRWQRGDGGGNASSDRYTFGTTATLPTGQWAFVALQTANYTNTVSTTYNYAYCYVYDSRTASWGWTNGASYISGTGVGMTYSGDSGTTTTQCMILNPFGNTSAGLVYELGHMYFLNQAVNSTTSINFVREQTDIYTA